MLAATTHKPLPLRPALAYLARVSAWILAFLGLVRVPWIQDAVLLPFTRLQLDVACGLTGTPTRGVGIVMSCTGADAMALVVGAILAFPVSWRSRLQGSLLGLALISLLNTVRLGHLAAIAPNRLQFLLWHRQVWPALLIVAAAAYVFLWMRVADRQSSSSAAAEEAGGAPKAVVWRLILVTSLMVGLFYAASGWIFRSPEVLAVARTIARFAAFLMSAVGVRAEISDIYLKTAQGTFAVTHECIATPLVAVYLAVFLALPMTLRRRALGLLLAAPIFFLLATGRLLVLALPQALVGSHLAAVHGFYQLLLGLGLLVVAAWWSEKLRHRPRAKQRALLAVATAVGAGVAIGPVWTGLLQGTTDLLAGLLGGLERAPDPQLAMALLPAFQLGLYLALGVALAVDRWHGWRRLLAGVGLLAAFQCALILVLDWLADRWELALPVVAIRALAVLVPVGLAGLLLRAPAASDETGSEAASRQDTVQRAD